MSGSVKVDTIFHTLPNAEDLCREIELETGVRPTVRRRRNCNGCFEICLRWSKLTDIPFIQSVFARAGWDQEFQTVLHYGERSR